MNLHGTLSIYLAITTTLIAGCSSSKDEPGSDGTGLASSEDVGATCTPGDEERTGFPGYSASEINVESRSDECATGICLGNHFEGRTNCPYGVDCETPSGDPITVDVPPQLVSRPPEDAMYCSCRCDGPSDQGPYCACPSDFECRPLVPDYGLSSRELSGSYCIKKGTYVEGTPPDGPRCDPALANCEDR